jgi:hypothetical protein
MNTKPHSACWMIQGNVDTMNCSLNAIQISDYEYTCPYINP